VNATGRTVRSAHAGGQTASKRSTAAVTSSSSAGASRRGADLGRPHRRPRHAVAVHDDDMAADLGPWLTARLEVPRQAGGRALASTGDPADRLGGERRRIARDHDGVPIGRRA
jgi:hypothetical protein